MSDLDQKTIEDKILSIFKNASSPLSRLEVSQQLNIELSKSTLNRYLDQLVENKLIMTVGGGRLMRYKLVVSITDQKTNLSTILPPLVSTNIPPVSHAYKSSLPPIFSIANPVTYLKICAIHQK